MNRLCFLKKFELFVLLTIGVSSATSFCKPAWPKHVYKKSVSAVKRAIKQAREKTSRMFPGIKATVKKRRGVALTENETSSFEQFKRRAIGSGIVVACASGVTAGYYYDIFKFIFPRPSKQPPKDEGAAAKPSSTAHQPVVIEIAIRESGLNLQDPAPLREFKQIHRDKVQKSQSVNVYNVDDTAPESGTGQSSAHPAAAVEEPQAEYSPAPPPPAPAPSSAGVLDPTSVTLRHVNTQPHTERSSPLQESLKKRTASLTHVDPAQVKKTLTDEQKRLAALASSPMLQQQARNASEKGDDPAADEGAGKDSWNKDAREYDEVKKEENGDPSDPHTAILDQKERDLGESAKTIARSSAMLGQPQQTSGPEIASTPCSAEEAANELERLLTEED